MSSRPTPPRSSWSGSLRGDACSTTCGSVLPVRFAKQLLVCLHANAQSDQMPGKRVSEQQEERENALHDRDLTQDAPVTPVPVLELQIECEQHWHDPELIHSAGEQAEAFMHVRPAVTHEGLALTALLKRKRS